ncbi:MAG: transposase [Clostridiales bacterium]|nr:transposase [Candidatus Crickella merdequi]
MSRAARKESPTGFYHVMQRGAGKQILFEDDNDCVKYLNRLKECTSNEGVQLVAYCLMNNHSHILVRACNLKTLSKAMARIGTSYANYYNMKYDHVGAVFQGRFLSEPICDERYLLACVRYIHNNPVKAGFAQRDAYLWSSYGEYIRGASLVDTDIVMNYFDGVEDFVKFSKSADDKMFMDFDIGATTCQIGQEVVKQHFNNNWDNSIMVKQLCKSERDAIIREMKAAGLNNHQIELVTGVSRVIIRKCK